MGYSEESTLSPAHSETLPLIRLVQFITGLALVASVVAGAWVYAVELPAQRPGQPPSNAYFGGGDSDGDSPWGGSILTCGPHYDQKGNLIGYTCCDSTGRPVQCDPNMPGDT